MTNLYSFIIGSGVTFGLIQVTRFAPSEQKTSAVHTSLWMLAGAILGARLIYTLMRPAYYLAAPAEIIAIWQGGLSWPGAILGGWASFWVYCQARHLNLREMASCCAPLVLPFAISCWLAGWAVGVGYGSLSSLSIFGAIPVPDEFGLIEPRIPLQLFAAVTLMIGIIIMEQLPAPWNSGTRYAALTMLFLSLHTLAFSFFRADPAPHFHSLRLESVTAMVFSIFSMTALLLSLPDRAAESPTPSIPQ